MFGPEKLSKVNANPIGDYPPGTLLAVAPRAVRVRIQGWNLVPDAHGRLWRARGPQRRPLFELVEFTPADLSDVGIEEDHQDAGSGVQPCPQPRHPADTECFQRPLTDLREVG